MASRARQLILKIQAGRALADCTDMEKAMIYNLRETQRLGRLLTEFADAAVDDGSISARSIELLKAAATINRLDPTEKADLYGED